MAVKVPKAGQSASTSSRLPPLLVLLSGGGRTMMNLLDRIDRGKLRARVTMVVASKECLGAQRARDRGIPTRIVPGVIPAGHLESLAREAAPGEPEPAWVVLAGYLKYVNVPEALRNRIVNIHPALLPEFGGKGMHGHHVHEAVLAAGATLSGCTVHLVDDRFDAGPILLQRTCQVLPGDTPDTLAARVFEQECEAYPAALELLLAGRIQIEGGHARFLSD